MVVCEGFIYSDVRARANDVVQTPIRDVTTLTGSISASGSYLPLKILVKPECPARCDEASLFFAGFITQALRPGLSLLLPTLPFSQLASANMYFLSAEDGMYASRKKKAGI
jgi:hypothetical protein